MNTAEGTVHDLDSKIEEFKSQLDPTDVFFLLFILSHKFTFTIWFLDYTLRNVLKLTNVCLLTFTKLLLFFLSKKIFQISHKNLKIHVYKVYKLKETFSPKNIYSFLAGCSAP